MFIDIRMVKTTVSNAILNEKNEARYKFFSDPPKERFNIPLPNFKADDILLMGSWFAINPELRNKVLELISLARRCRNSHCLRSKFPGSTYRANGEIKTYTP